MTVEDLIAEELDKSGGFDLAGLPLEVELDGARGTYTISGPLPRPPQEPGDDAS